MTDVHGTRVPSSPVSLAAISPIPLKEGEFLPAALTVDLGDWLKLSVPLGAFTVNGDRPRFVTAVDVVGLSAAFFGIGVGALAVRSSRPIIKALAAKIRAG